MCVALAPIKLSYQHFSAPIKNKALVPADLRFIEKQREEGKKTFGALNSV